jgi:hypothetical protein
VTSLRLHPEGRPGELLNAFQALLRVRSDQELKQKPICVRRKPFIVGIKIPLSEWRSEGGRFELALTKTLPTK